MAFTQPFKKLNKESFSIAGGKGAQLGELFNSGIPVPNGFVVLTQAYTQFIDANNLGEKIDTEREQAKAGDAASVELASKNIRKMILDSPVPKEIEQEIVQAFDGFEQDFVAVRSSATAEDAHDASWAGELETYTNITRDGLVDAIKKCWSSLFTPRAIVYRTEKNMAQTTVAVAVVVQAMVDSEVAGVVFTADPVSKDQNKIIIEAAFGLGESVVGGLVTPDHYVVDKKEGFIEDITVNSQSTMLVKEKGKTTRITVPPERQELQKLDGKHIIELANLCRKIEVHYNFPQDIEFALEKEKLYILQTRPITTL